MKLFDLHCDTLTEAYHRLLSPWHNEALMLSFHRIFLEDYVQVMAIWCRNELDDDSAFDEFLAISDYYHTAVATPPQGIVTANGRIRTLLAVEDARLLGHDLDRLDRLVQAGVKILTLTWAGCSSVGGAWDTDEGLSPFGRDLVKEAASRGIVLDLSHASDKLFWETLALADACGGRVIASHSCARALCPHRRNLTDEMFCALAERGGLVGVSFVPQHLAADGNASLADVARHILHFLSLNAPGGESALAIGSDFDGIAHGPQGLSRIEDVPLFARRLVALLGREQAEKILWGNACRFFIPELAD